jgi:murein DD-endopeptidase MepM/ murein hydrolase activator NlpD
VDHQRSTGARPDSAHSARSRSGGATRPPRGVLAALLGTLGIAFSLLLGAPSAAHAYGPSITVGVSPGAFSPDGDGTADVARINLRLWRATRISASILDTGTVVRRLPSATMRPGRRTLVWDGKLANGSVASFGRYDVRVLARGLDRRWRIVTVQVTVLAPPSPPVALQWPLTGEISSGFGPRGSSTHDGIDILADSMTPIAAAAAGRVRSASFISGYGNTVIIDHADGRATLYAHQAKFIVAAGAQVTAGQVIGYVGQTGDATCPHLHFEVHDANDVAVDPIPQLPAQQPAAS